MPGTVILPHDGQLQMLSWNIASNILLLKIQTCLPTHKFGSCAYITGVEINTSPLVRD